MKLIIVLGLSPRMKSPGSDTAIEDSKIKVSNHLLSFYILISSYYLNSLPLISIFTSISVYNKSINQSILSIYLFIYLLYPSLFIVIDILFL